MTEETGFRALALGLFAASILFLPSPANAQTKTASKPAAAPDTHPGVAKTVKDWTTRPEFSSPLVDFLPLKKGIPTPKDVLGRYVGQPNRLTTTTEAYSYYRALGKASPRVRADDQGPRDLSRLSRSDRRSAQIH